MFEPLCMFIYSVFANVCVGGYLNFPRQLSAISANWLAAVFSILHMDWLHCMWKCMNYLPRYTGVNIYQTIVHSNFNFVMQYP